MQHFVDATMLHEQLVAQYLSSATPSFEYDNQNILVCPGCGSVVPASGNGSAPSIFCASCQSQNITEASAKHKYPKKKSPPLIACSNCGLSRDETPLMRAGPLGPASLCNACGLHYKKSGQLRMVSNLHPCGRRYKKRREDEQRQKVFHEVADAMIRQDLSEAEKSPVCQPISQPIPARTFPGAVLQSEVVRPSETHVASSLSETVRLLAQLEEQLNKVNNSL